MRILMVGWVDLNEILSGLLMSAGRNLVVFVLTLLYNTRPATKAETPRKTPPPINTPVYDAETVGWGVATGIWVVGGVSSVGTGVADVISVAPGLPFISVVAGGVVAIVVREAVLLLVSMRAGVVGIVV